MALTKVAKKMIGIQGQITTKFDSIIYDPWYYKNFLLVSCPDLGEKIAQNNILYNWSLHLSVYYIVT